MVYPSSPMPKTASILRIELLDVKPLVWRRIVVPVNIQLPKLHKIIQAVMGWEDSDLHLFNIGGTSYGVLDDEFPDDHALPEKAVRLSKVLGSDTEFEYQYDFGDNWQHRIVVEAIGVPDLALTLPVCLAGENACPPEDVGGVSGYDRFREALADPENEEHLDYRTWVGGIFDPAGFDVNAVNSRLRAIR
ncbi:plasmid pRiA4b ORF-3 family protein [Cupriavidus sp. WKF15]|uniref:plasmid pRiA4b ORF-3 family protein n=1 Tax=Cupriavidus sp. WKF15 TaxID=3032282 RepID=UPI0023E33A12|nr:plasmid pRiA4b ORF-3 family protein [Cupriavidus sp. WKF15]WER50547.1 plasmid pRiA4b ORF-3 family protein [Cupriavidus sp. WKF15]